MRCLLRLTSCGLNTNWIMYSMCPFYSTVALSHCCSVLSFWMKINGDALPRMTMTITRVLHPPLEGDNVLTSLYCSVRPGEGIQCTWERAANNIQQLSWQTAISKRLRVSSPFLLQWTWFQLHESCWFTFVLRELLGSECCIRGPAAAGFCAVRCSDADRDG